MQSFKLKYLDKFFHLQWGPGHHMLDKHIYTPVLYQGDIDENIHHFHYSHRGADLQIENTVQKS